MLKGTITYYNDFEVKKRLLKPAVKNSLLHSLKFWHRQVLPVHFTHRGATRYDYKARTSHYEKRKLRKYKHTYPLVFTGKFKRELINRRHLKAPNSAYATRATLHMKTTRTFNLSKAKHMPNIKNEVTAIDNKDRQELVKVFDHKFSKEMRKTQATTRTTKI